MWRTTGPKAKAAIEGTAAILRLLCGAPGQCLDGVEGRIEIQYLSLAKLEHLLAQWGQPVLSLVFEQSATKVLFELFEHHGMSRLHSAKLVCRVRQISRQSDGTETAQRLYFDRQTSISLKLS